MQNSILSSQTVIIRLEDSSPNFSLSDLFNFLKSKLQKLPIIYSLEDIQRISFYKEIFLNEKLICINVSEDGEMIVTGSTLGFHLWNSNTFQKIASFSQQIPIRAVCITKDKKFVVSGDEKNEVIVWNIQKRKIEYTLTDHTDEIYHVEVDHKGFMFASASRDRNIFLWNLSDGKKIKTLLDHTDTVRVIRFSKNDEYLVSGSWDTTIKIWDIASGTCLRTLEGHKNLVLGLWIAPNDEYIVSASFDTTIRIWSFNGNLVHILIGHNSYVYGAVVSEDGRYLASCSNDNSIIFWDIKTGEMVNFIENAHFRGITGICWVRDKIYTCSQDKTVKIWKCQ